MPDRTVFTRIVYDAERWLTSPCWKADAVRWIAIMLSAPAVTACGQALDNEIPRRSQLTVVIDEMQRKNSLDVAWFDQEDIGSFGDLDEIFRDLRSDGFRVDLNQSNFDVESFVCDPTVPESMAVFRMNNWLDVSRLTYQVIVYFDGDCRIERVSASLMPEDGIF